MLGVGCKQKQWHSLIIRFLLVFSVIILNMVFELKMISTGWTIKFLSYNTLQKNFASTSQVGCKTSWVVRSWGSYTASQWLGQCKSLWRLHSEQCEYVVCSLLRHTILWLNLARWFRITVDFPLLNYFVWLQCSRGSLLSMASILHLTLLATIGFENQSRSFVSKVQSIVWKVLYLNSSCRHA